MTDTEYHEQIKRADAESNRILREFGANLSPLERLCCMTMAKLDVLTIEMQIAQHHATRDEFVAAMSEQTERYHMLLKQALAVVSSEKAAQA